MLNKRLLKALRNVQRNKYNDFGGVCALADKGYLDMSGTSDDVSIQITQKGLDALESVAPQHEPIKTDE